ncbi:Reverse transcriptase domain [Trinorchestia longiramus]|nr:Reverse transcriptase domain [Trinorchestia longiramus]
MCLLSAWNNTSCSCKHQEASADCSVRELNRNSQRKEEENQHNKTVHNTRPAPITQYHTSTHYPVPHEHQLPSTTRAPITQYHTKTHYPVPHQDPLPSTTPPSTHYVKEAVRKMPTIAHAVAGGQTQDNHVGKEGTSGIIMGPSPGIPMSNPSSIPTCSSLCFLHDTTSSNLGIATQWFQSYLANRSHAVRLENTISSPIQNDFDVPQGSILGPLLFSIFINDFPSMPSNTKISMYADDVQIAMTSVPAKLSQTKSNAEIRLKHVKSWYDQNGLKLNASKTQCIIFGSKNTIKKLPNLTFTLGNDITEPVGKVKNLGVWFDENMSFTSHVEKTCSKINGTLPREEHA